MTISDPALYTLHFTVEARKYERLNEQASKDGFATVEEYLVAHALNEKSVYVAPAAVVSQFATGGVQVETDPKSEKKAKG